MRGRNEKAEKTQKATEQAARSELCLCAGLQEGKAVIIKGGEGMSEWISVEDRLPSLEGLEPDEVEYVLVSEQYFDAITGEKLGSYVSICGFGHDGWSKFDNFGYVRTENITHWMPMPCPPQEV